MEKKSFSSAKYMQMQVIDLQNLSLNASNNLCLMQKVQAEHAEHPAIRLAYQVPFEDPEFRLMDVRWTVETGLLEIRDGTYPRHYWRGEVKDWAAVAAGTVSVGLRDLELCERVKEGEPTCEKGAMPPDSAKKGERSKSAKAKSKSPKPKPKPAE